MSTLVDAMKLVGDDDSVWFRPVSWRGAGQAFCITNGSVYRVPSLRGGDLYMTTEVAALIGPWEVVEPYVVNSEVGE